MGKERAIERARHILRGALVIAEQKAERRTIAAMATVDYHLKTGKTVNLKAEIEQVEKSSFRYEKVHSLALKYANFEREFLELIGDNHEND